MKPILKFVACIFLMGVASCSNYMINTSHRLPPPETYLELKFEDLRWELTADSLIATLNLPDAISRLSLTDIKGVTIIKRGYETNAGYLNWGRDNLYKYEIINSRIVLYWQMENSFNSISDQVTVIVKLQG